MNENFKIEKIEKYEQQKYKSIISIVNNIKLLSFFGILILASAIDGLENQTEELIMGGSVTFGTINFISLVKSICNVYKSNEEIKRLKNENRQK